MNHKNELESSGPKLVGTLLTSVVSTDSPPETMSAEAVFAGPSLMTP